MSDIEQASVENPFIVCAQNKAVTPKNKEGLLTWINNHKTQLILAGISIATIIAVACGLKHKNEIKKLWNRLNEELAKASIYSS